MKNEGGFKQTEIGLIPEDCEVMSPRLNLQGVART
jgi:hypothetical protein